MNTIIQPNVLLSLVFLSDNVCNDSFMFYGVYLFMFLAICSEAWKRNGSLKNRVTTDILTWCHQWHQISLGLYMSYHRCGSNAYNFKAIIMRFRDNRNSLTKTTGILCVPHKTFRDFGINIQVIWITFMLVLYFFILFGKVTI